MGLIPEISVAVFFLGPLGGENEKMVTRRQEDECRRRRWRFGGAVPRLAQICTQRIHRERDVMLIDEASGLSPYSPVELPRDSYNGTNLEEST